jgi:hypothetical protein
MSARRFDTGLAPLPPVMAMGPAQAGGGPIPSGLPGATSLRGRSRIGRATMARIESAMIRQTFGASFRPLDPSLRCAAYFASPGMTEKWNMRSKSSAIWRSRNPKERRLLQQVFTVLRFNKG